MHESQFNLKKELVKLLRLGCYKWRKILLCFLIGSAAGLLFVLLTPQMYKTSQVAYYKLDLDQIDFNITEIYSTLSKDTKLQCSMGQVYDFKMRRRFVIDQFANTVTFVSTGPSVQENIDCLKQIVGDVSTQIYTIERLRRYRQQQASEQLEPFKVLTEPVTVEILTYKFKVLIVVASGFGVIGIWLFCNYLTEFLRSVIIRYRRP